MKNKELYEEKLQKSSETRWTLNEDLHPIMKKLATMFKLVFNEKPKFFKFVKDALYYKGGYPKEDSPARLDVFVENFAKLYLYYAKLGLTKEIDEKLNLYGLKTNLIEEITNEDYDVSKESFSEFSKLWYEIFNDKNIPSKTDIPTKSNEILKILVDEGLSLQSTICQLADTIKIDDANEVEQNCEIKRPHYVKAVNLKYKTLKNKPLDKDIENIKKNIESIENSIEVF